MALVVPSATMSAAKSIGGAALAALLRNPQALNAAAKLFKGFMSSSSSGSNSKPISGRRRRRKGSKINPRVHTDRFVSAPLTQSLVRRVNRRMAEFSGKAQLSRYLGTGISCTRFSGTELMNYQLVAPNNTVTSNVALFSIVTATLIGQLNIGPFELGPFRLTDVGKTYCWYAIRRLRLRAISTCTPTSIAGSTQVSLGLIRNNTTIGSTGSPGVDIVTKQAHVDAMDHSVTFPLWNNAELDYTYDGDQVFSTDASDVNGGVFPDQQYQLAMFAIGDANSGSGSNLLGSTLESDYVVDFYIKRPDINQGVTLKECPQTGLPFREPKYGRLGTDKTVDGISGIALPKGRGPFVSVSVSDDDHKSNAPRCGKDEVVASATPSRSSYFGR